MLNILFKASLPKTLTKTFSVNNISDSKDKLQLKYQYKILKPATTSLEFNNNNIIKCDSTVKIKNL